VNNKFSKIKMKLFSNSIDTLFSYFFAAKKKYQPKSPPIFIMGSGRNGSTLLTCILNNHSQLFIPVEHSFIPTLLKYYYLNPFLSWNKKVKKVISILNKSNYWGLDLIELENVLKNASKKQQSPAFIIESVYLQLGNRNNKSNFIWGDKTPSNTPFIKLINSQFDNCTLLFLVRDPRDYMASLLTMNENNKKLVNFHIWRWKNALKKYESLKSINQDRVRLLTYEAMVKNPENEIYNLFDWLNLERQSDVFSDYSQNMSLLHANNLKHHEKINQPIDTDSIDLWKTKLTESQIKTIEKKLGFLMEKYGYPLYYK
jgi:hypothetical protein